VSILQFSTALTIVAALLAVGAGLTKLVSPRSAVLAMRSVGLPSSDAAVRLGSLVECVVAAATLVSPSWIPRLLLALSFLALSAFVAAALRTGRAIDCGCFGAAGGEIGRRHLALNAALCVGVAASLLTRSGAIAGSVRLGSLSGAAVLLVGIVSALLAATYVAHEGAP
jgi:Methylamine utilisation protein MauE